MASVAIALFPKCPMCWAAYLGATGVAGLDALPYAPWLVPALAVAMVLHLGGLFLRARATGRFGPLLLASAGASLVLAARYVPAIPALLGVALIVAGTAWSADRREVSGRDGAASR